MGTPLAQEPAASPTADLPIALRNKPRPPLLATREPPSLLLLLLVCAETPRREPLQSLSLHHHLSSPRLLLCSRPSCPRPPVTATQHPSTVHCRPSDVAAAAPAPASGQASHPLFRRVGSCVPGLDGVASRNFPHPHGHSLTPGCAPASSLATCRPSAELERSSTLIHPLCPRPLSPIVDHRRPPAHHPTLSLRRRALALTIAIRRHHHASALLPSPTHRRTHHRSPRPNPPRPVAPALAATLHPQCLRRGR
jgi:hypothetical protein